MDKTEWEISTFALFALFAVGPALECAAILFFALFALFAVGPALECGLILLTR